MSAPETTLIVDLQHGITALPTVHPADEIVSRCARLTTAFRARPKLIAATRVVSSPTIQTESLEFRTWWKQYAVREFRTDRPAIEHPTAGRIQMDLFQLRPVDHPSLTIVLQSARTATDRQLLQQLLDSAETSSNRADVFAPCRSSD